MWKGLILESMIIVQNVEPVSEDALQRQLLLNTAFSYGMFYIDISSELNLLMLLFEIFVLRKSMKETISMLVIAIVFGIIIEMIIPFSIW